MQLCSPCHMGWVLAAWWYAAGAALSGRPSVDDVASLCEIRAKAWCCCPGGEQMQCLSVAQEVTDAEGRRRFHGAFTGGWSAGYYNTGALSCRVWCWGWMAMQAAR